MVIPRRFLRFLLVSCIVFGTYLVLQRDQEGPSTERQDTRNPPPEFERGENSKMADDLSVNVASGAQQEPQGTRK